MTCTNADTTIPSVIVLATASCPVNAAKPYAIGAKITCSKEGSPDIANVDEAIGCGTGYTKKVVATTTTTTTKDSAASLATGVAFAAAAAALAF